MEEMLKSIVEDIEEKAYIPGDWYGVSESKVVSVDDVKSIIQKYIDLMYE